MHILVALAVLGEEFFCAQIAWHIIKLALCRAGYKR